MANVPDNDFFISR